MKKNTIKFIIYFIGFFIIFSTKWIRSNFGLSTPEQIVFQISLIKSAVTSVPVDLLKSFALECFMTSIFSLFIVYLLDKYSSFTYNIINLKKFSFIEKSIFSFTVNNFHIFILIFSILYFCIKFSVVSYVSGISEKEEYSNNHTSLEEINITAKNPKNLVLIYLESMEDTYKNKNYFDKNLLLDLDNIKGTSFTKFKQLRGIGWTMAGIFSTQCGKYITPSFIEDKNICLSNILAERGYYNVFMNGTSLDFTKLGDFLKKNKYHEAYGREEWLSKGYKEMNEWGLYDDDLFSEARKKLKSLHKQDRLFSLVILTGDTHMSKGYPSNYCKENNLSSSLAEIAECSSKQVSSFVKFIQDNGYSKNTNIVIIGDHLFPKIKLSNKIIMSKRYIFNKFISDDNFIKSREEIVHFDLLPSILLYIGFDFKGERLFNGKYAFDKK